MLMWCVLLFGLTGCGNNVGNASGFISGRGYGGITSQTTALQEEETQLSYDNSFIGVVVSMDIDRKLMSIYDINRNATDEYQYTGATDIQNKTGQVIAAAQIRLGDIVECQFNEDGHVIQALKEASEAWEYPNIKSFTMDRTNLIIKIGKSTYKFNNSLIVISNGELVAPSYVSSQDEISVKGIGTSVYSIVVTKGHGALKLENTEEFVGGMISVGNKILETITKNMVLDVPVGDYRVEVTKDDAVFSQRVVIFQNEETIIDMEEMGKKAREVGTIKFTIKPEGAVLYLDDKETAYDEVVELYYDTYEIRVEKEGYVPYIADLLISKPYQTREILLGKEEAESGETQTEAIISTSSTSLDTQQTASQNQTTHSGPTVTTPTVTVPTVTAPTVQTPTTTQTGETTKSPGPGAVSDKELSAYKIHIETPVGASVYLDGEFIGTAPLNFPKVSGQHTILLKKDGYKSKTYTVTFSSDKADSHYSFEELEPN